MKLLIAYDGLNCADAAVAGAVRFNRALDVFRSCSGELQYSPASKSDVCWVQIVWGIYKLLKPDWMQECK